MKILKQYGAWAMIVVFCLILAWPILTHAAAKAPYKIGVNLELTGPWAEVTKTVKMTMVLEVERINEMGG